MRKRIISALLAVVLMLSLCPMASADYAEMKSSAELITFIKEYEGCSLTKIKDAGGWAIGYGHHYEKESDCPASITQAQADEFLKSDLVVYEKMVNNFLKEKNVTLKQNQFDALVSLTYNLGNYWIVKTGEWLTKFIADGSDKYSQWQVTNAFARWSHVGSDVWGPLVDRRIDEADMFLTGNYKAKDVTGWSKLRVNSAGGTVQTDIFVYKTGEKYDPLPETTREGYTFGGWKNSAGEIITTETKVAKDDTITAVWTGCPFSDVAKDAWYYDTVTALADMGVINGYEDGTFRPQNNVSNGEMLKLAVTASGYGTKSPTASHWASGYLSFAETHGFIRSGEITDYGRAMTRDGVAELVVQLLHLDTSKTGSNPFSDTTSANVIALYDAGIVQGSVENGKRLYKGSTNITRAEASAIILRVSDYVAKNGNDTSKDGTLLGQTAAPSAGFTDVSGSDWFAGYVNELAAAGIVNGYGDGRFGPKDNVTYGAALALILRTTGYGKPTATSSHWASGYLSRAKALGFVEGNPGLDDAITRDEIANISAKALGLDTTKTYENLFSDSTNQSVLALYSAGIMEGSVEGDKRLYKGTSNISRAEICAVIWRMEKYVREHPDSFIGPNTYDTAKFSLDADNHLHYSDTGLPVQYGIDVSQYQGTVDWAKVKASGIDFAIIRCGYRETATGKLMEDPNFKTYIDGATKAGLKIGLYLFSQALTADEAKEEANYAVSLAKGYTITLPIAFDWEPIPGVADSRTKNFDTQKLTDLALAFCDTVEASGYKSMVYINKDQAYNQYNLNRLSSHTIWLANYAPSRNYVTDFIYDFQFYQYSGSGRVDGINHDVDLDICFVNMG